MLFSAYLQSAHGRKQTSGCRAFAASHLIRLLEGCSQATVEERSSQTISAGPRNAPALALEAFFKPSPHFAGLPTRSGCYDARAADLFACGVGG